MKKLFILFIIFIIIDPINAADFSYGRGADEAEDSYLASGAPSANYSTNATMENRYNTINHHAILRFAVIDADIAGETISSATLTLQFRFTNIDHTVYLYRIRPARDFVVSQVTWVDYKSLTAWSTAGGSNTTSDIFGTATASFYANDGQGDNYDWSMDVTADVQAWADGDANNGWLTQANTPGVSGAASQIWASEWIASTARPYLEITTGIAESIPTRRRKIIIKNMRGDNCEENIIFSYIPVEHKQRLWIWDCR